jgi:dihydroorotate dehydrogenase
MRANMTVRIGNLEFRNPVICGSGEQVMTAAGIRAAIAAGAAAVIAKSTNESDAAREQLDGTDYAKLSSDLDILSWDQKHRSSDYLFCRSGLAPVDPKTWLVEIAQLDQEAATSGAYVAASIIPADFDRAIKLAEFASRQGIRIIEINIGAPHGTEAAEGAIMVEKDSDRVRFGVQKLRSVVSGALWIKLTGNSDNIADLALAAKDGGADAVVMMGRAIAFLPDLDSMEPLLGTNAGYGGNWALPLTCRWLAASRRLLGSETPLIGTNGVRTGLDVARMMLSGADAIEMTSAIITGGFGVITDTINELEEYLTSKQCAAVDIVGVAADKLSSYGDQISRPGYWKNFVPPETISDDKL